MKLTFGCRRAFKGLEDRAATALILRLDEVAARPAEAALPYLRITEIGGLRVSYEVRTEEVCVWSIARL